MFFRKYRFPLLWAAFIAILCGMPGKDIPHISFLELLEFDKFVHASVFFILVFFLVRAYLKGETTTFFQQHAFTISALIAIAYGGLLEILQGLIFIDRTADVYDFIANSFGAVMAVVLIRKFKMEG